MTDNATHVRRAAEAEKRLDAAGTPSAQRHAERQRLMKVIEAEEATTAAAAAARAETLAERERIAACVAEGRRVGKARQALRFALIGSPSAEDLRPVLAALPADAAAPETALALIPAPPVGSVAAVAECRRIAGIMGHAEAEGRFEIAASLAFASDLDAVAAVAALAGTPKVARYNGPSLAERSAAAGDFGVDHGAGSGQGGIASRSASIWKKAVTDANRSIGAAPSGEADAAQERARMAALRAQVDTDAATRIEAEATRIVGDAGGRIE